jgi:hypothetical protein
MGFAVKALREVSRMSNILVGYDLNKAGKDYTSLIDAIKKAFPTYWHCLDSTWIVVTDWTPAQVRDYLGKFMDANDELFVVDITGKSAAWAGFDKDCSSWLSNNL